ncbi:hypothetical protein FisN_18Lh181 [Fistulifera solaris]|uniref:Ketoreductase domain-containing protein n=1 Tax=Fistulifera solaris TaxID=1519565 RepID=A0A1Z5JU20_FISSO|nr:hypothetical protein FisN_18Lh181 [Fistulifera solaris]|eukprot:GAX17533.1 hypothetical protein FisN_18Lh181 [Fistulifera solaris]
MSFCRNAALLLLILTICVNGERPSSSLPLSRRSLQQSSPNDDSSSTNDKSIVSSSFSSAWPPWPFNLLSPTTTTTTTRSSSSGWKNRAWQQTRQSLKVAARHTQQLTSSLYMHLPPAAHPFLMIACIPRHQKIPLFSNPLARSIGLASMGMAIVSWAHCDWYRQKSLVPLPLVYPDVHRAILPPFLPETPPLEVNTRNKDSSPDPTTNRAGIEENRNQWLPFRHKWSSISKIPWPLSRRWQTMRQKRHMQRLQERRRVIYDELVALQTLKRQQTMKHEDTKEPLGYALVTGASKGIGRAIAVELARWEIPLILVARNIDRLISLANDLENCYGVKCCVLEADLSKPHVAERVYKTTQEAGLRVDILVNNAGTASHGIIVDQPLKEVNQMLQLNADSSAVLSNLFGHEMKKRRRGRILFVSSVSGTVAGISTLALYSATKAFQNSLAVALAKEMEPWGVGVTCLMPGAVEDTDFSKNTDNALCWKIPFYPKKPQIIAKVGVRAMLLGETEVVPGWQNRFFVKVLKPALPQRLHNVIAETAWNPIRPPFQNSHRPGLDAENQNHNKSPTPPAPARPSNLGHFFSQPGPQRLPRLLLLGPEPNEMNDGAKVEVDPSDLSHDHYDEDDRSEPVEGTSDFK